jgi:ribosomal protein S18 acetylase RimI-like enzyme
MKFVKLNKFSESEILETHNEAFSDYEVPMQISLDSFKYLNLRRGVRYDLSLGAVEGEKLIGFILNAVDMWEEKLTAYDCGTGIIPNYREKGLGNQIFTNLLPLLKADNIKQYILEVIQTNVAAYNLYKKRNFQIIREFDCLLADIQEINLKIQDDNLEKGYSIREVNSLNWKQVKKFRNYPPSWQNSDSSIQRVPSSFQYLGAFFKNKLVGYLVYEPSGGITQLGVDPNHRTQNISTGFIKYMIKKESNIEKVNIINIDRRDTWLLGSLTKMGFKSFTTQYEMLVEI